jgi:hypothetical protein
VSAPEAGGSGDDIERVGGGLTEVDAIAERLRELAERLRDPELPAGEAEQLAREAADLVGTAGNEIDRASRALGDESGP